MRDDVGELAGQRFRIGRAAHLLAAPEKARGQAGKAAAKARIAAQHDVPLIDIAFPHDVEIVRRRRRDKIG